MAKLLPRCCVAPASKGAGCVRLQLVTSRPARLSWRRSLGPAGPPILPWRQLHRGPLRWENSRTLQMRRLELDRYLIELLDQEVWLQGVKYMLADPNLKNRPWPH